MARKKFENDMSVEYTTADAQGRLIMAQYLCELREANDPQLEIKEQVVREALKRLSTHGMQKFDSEVDALMILRKEGLA